MRYEEIAALDRRLTMDAHALFRDVDHFTRTGNRDRSAFEEIFLPLALPNRLVEVTDDRGGELYLSSGLLEPLSGDGITSFHVCKINGRSIRMGHWHLPQLA